MIDFIKTVYPVMANFSDDVILGSLIVVAVGMLIYYVIASIAFVGLFKKMGISTPLAFVPIYRECKLFLSVWDVKALVSVVVFYMVTVGSKYLRFADMPLMSFLVPLCSVIAGILFMVWQIRYLNRLAKSFGKGVGFTIGLYFLNLIFLFILGYGKSKFRAKNN